MHGTRVLQESEQIKTRFWIGAGDHLITMHTMTPAELNLTEGISRTLTTQIVEYITREDARNRTNANENTRKRRETAQAAIDQHKRMTAGLHFWVQLYLHICGRLIGDIKFSGTKRRKSK